MSKRRVVVLGVLAAVALMASGAASQDAQPPPRDQRGSRQQSGRADRGDSGTRGRFDPSRFRQRYMDRIKESLDVKDDEWKVIQPRLEEVTELSRQARSGGGMRTLFGRRGRRGGTPAGGGADQEKSALAKATEALEKALKDKASSADAIKAKLKGLREVREEAKDKLAQSRTKLRQVLTQRQEAQLVLFGILD